MRFSDVSRVQLVSTCGSIVAGGEDGEEGAWSISMQDGRMRQNESLDGWAAGEHRFSQAFDIKRIAGRDGGDTINRSQENLGSAT